MFVFSFLCLSGALHQDSVTMTHFLSELKAISSNLYLKKVSPSPRLSKKPLKCVSFSWFLTKMLLCFDFLALIGVDLPNNKVEPQPTEPSDWLQELIDQLGTSLTTTTPIPTTTRPSRSTKRKGKRKKGKHRTAAVPELHNGAVRLVNDDQEGKDRGRVEIYINGEWGTVCDDLWTIKNAEVVCRQLGFRYALRASRNSEFGEGRGLRILLDDVQCVGTESSLLTCTHAGVGTHNCAHYEDAGVICANSEHVVEA